MTQIIPVLLAGGSGERLWPLSRADYPKQFARLIDEDTLLQSTAKRFKTSEQVHFAPPIVVTNDKFRFVVSDQMLAIGTDLDCILIEPSSKDSAPAILSAAIYAYNKDKKSIILVAPTDHFVPDIENLHSIIGSGLQALEQRKIVTFGINPRYASTAYGYLQVSKAGISQCEEVINFVEKPNQKDAELMLNDGSYLWNSGMYLMNAYDIIEQFKTHSADIYEAVLCAIENGKSDLDFFKLDLSAWDKCPKISIDYAIMEKVSNLVSLRFNSEWSDLGGWDAVWDLMPHGGNGNATSGNAHAIKCKNSMVRSEAASMEVVCYGLSDALVIATQDAVVVTNRHQLSEYKQVVKYLKSIDMPQADKFPFDHRPWGYFETLALNDRFHVKKIAVKPAASLSLQKHYHRSEHWVIVRGTAKVLVNGVEKIITEGESVYIPLGSEHRLENPGKIELILIEVQVGSYLKEDDIIRLSDVYKRHEI